MARRPAPISYSAALIVEQPGTQTLAPPAAPSPAPNSVDDNSPGDQSAVTPFTRHAPAPTVRPQVNEETAGEGRGRRPLEDKSDPSVLYLHPAGKKALRLYAVEKGCKVHDLLLEAVEEWADARGLAGPWRVPSAGPARRKRG